METKTLAPATALMGNVDPNKLMQQAGQLILRDREGKPYTNEQRALIVLAAQQLGLNPILGHLTIIQDRLYITNAGLLHIAHNSGKLEGIKTRPATEEERKAYFLGSDPKDIHLWKAEVYLKGQKEPYVGWGKASMNEKSWAVKSNPQEMAETRAVNRALRKAFNIAGYTSVEELEDENTPAVKSEEEPITKEQIKIIHAIASLIGEDFYDYQFKEWLRSQIGKESSTELTKSEASEIIDRLLVLLEDQLKAISQSAGIDFEKILQKHGINSLTETDNYYVWKEIKEEVMKKRYRKGLLEAIQNKAKEKGLETDKIKKIIKEKFQAESSKDLSNEQLEELLQIIENHEDDDVPF
ncbi:RecT family protein [Persephonella hydrogeniphila]|uniref:RecT family protein n=1 Tax=Persephonella hydrogeniphila TaxID=198703 RepID=A0A285NK29_9AQUI|nr:recombinase RecT [Persephonella hydrogeniphila]SNZ08236.1 RecT family protein [Persephonella hydrogeniphila]